MPTPKAGFSKGLKEINQERVEILGKLRDKGPFEDEGSNITKEIAEKIVNGILGSVFTNNLEAHNNQDFNEHINTTLDFIIDKTKKEGNFSQRLQSNYKSILENTEFGNFKIIKSEYKHLDEEINIILEYKGKIVQISGKINNKDLQTDKICIGGIVYRFNKEKGIYLGYMNKEITIMQDDIKTLKELQADVDLFKDLEGRENIHYDPKHQTPANINTVLGPSPYTELNPE